MPSPFATTEDPASLWYEESNYISTHIAAVGYGLHVAIFAIVTYCTIQRRDRHRRWLGWLAFNTALFIIGTINLACSINFNESAWVTERNYPGGPFQFIIEQQNRPVLTVGNSASILASFMADGLLLYRVMVLWNYTWYIITIPTLFYLACVALSVVTVIQFAVPGVGNIVNLSLPVWIVLMIINILLSTMIATRILLMRHRVKSILGNEHAKPYTGVASVIIESALPFTVLSIILLILFGKENTAQNLFVPLLVQVECIAPELIILRVILGRSWSSETLSRVSHTLQFAPPQRTTIGGDSVWNRSQAHDGASVVISEDSSPTSGPHEKEAKRFSRSEATVV